MYCLFINERQVEKYNGEILKRYVGNRLVKTIANPTDEDLREFGYMPLIEMEEPQYNKETQYLSFHYETDGQTISKVWKVEEIPVEEIPVEEDFGM